ncbi:MAG: flavodoxin family protein [Thermoguttaceae bacterium]|nr:flavodoxin family protein [Thermoguttaceae bacterium]
MKKVLIISSSPRKEGNSELLAREFARGAESAGNQTEIVRLNEMRLGYCQGCYACTKTGKCFQNDGMNELAEKVRQADVLVLATPVYFYTMSGQMKVFIDRLVPVYTEVRADIYFLATAWDPNVENLELTAESLRGCTRDCFEECEEKGVLLVGDVQDKGDVLKKTEAMKQAFEMGKGV